MRRRFVRESKRLLDANGKRFRISVKCDGIKIRNWSDSLYYFPIYEKILVYGLQIPRCVLYMSIGELKGRSILKETNAYMPVGITGNLKGLIYQINYPFAYKQD